MAIDGLKEVQEAVMLIEAGLSTYEKECAKRGDDYQEIFSQQVRETMERRAAGLKPPAWAASAFESGLKNSNEEERWRPSCVISRILPAWPLMSR
jgi:capsid protein